MKWAGVLFLFAGTGCAFAQDAFVDAWTQARAANPAGVEFAISLPKTSFYIGEVLPLQLELTAGREGFFYSNFNAQDGTGREAVAEEFVIDPVRSTEDPLVSATGTAGIAGSGMSGLTPLRGKPLGWQRDVNEWIRFLQPGTYRLYVRTRRVREQLPGKTTGPSIRDGNEQRILASNVLTIEVSPAPAEWVEERISQAVQYLRSPHVGGTAEFRKFQATLRTLAFLDTLEADLALLPELSGEDSSDMRLLNAHIVGSLHGRELLPVLEQQLIAPDRAIRLGHLLTLSHLAVRVEAGRQVFGGTDDSAEFKRRYDLERARRAGYIGRLIQALPAKQPAARTVSVQTLLIESFATQAMPAWAPLIAKDVIANFRGLAAWVQVSALQTRWDLLKSPAMIPVLRDLYATSAETGLDNETLARLMEIAPAEARTLLIAQLKQPSKQLRWTTLAMLPDASLPELDEVFASDYEAGGRIEDRVIARYASGAIAKRLEQVYERRYRGARCQPDLLVYFLKYDPAFGEQWARANIQSCGSLGVPADMHPSTMSPALERLAIEHLMKETNQVKRESAETLGKYGSAAARRPLWSTLETFNSWWKGRGEELDKNVESRDAEVALVAALTQSRAWKLTLAELAKLASLCVSQACKGVVEKAVR